MPTTEQKASNDETRKHIARVAALINVFVKELLRQAEIHDASKLESPEMEVMAEFYQKLYDSEFQGEEYEANRAAMAKALEHHYAVNGHHPEHYKNGIEDMNLVMLIVMFSDWKASSERQNGGNIRLSIARAAERFGISPQLERIFENTISLLETT